MAHSGLEALLAHYSLTIHCKNSFIDITYDSPPQAQLQKSSSAPVLLTLATKEEEDRSRILVMQDNDHEQPQHDFGMCRPCAYVLKADGCRNGASCTFCHLHSKADIHRWFRHDKRKFKKSLRNDAGGGSTWNNMGLKDGKTAGGGSKWA